MEVTDPPKAAPTEMDASISSADSGSIENVNGMRIAMATGPPSPGRTPTHSPITVPTTMNIVRKVDIEEIGADERQDRHRDERGDHELPAVRVSHQHRDEQHRRERGDDEADEPEHQAE